MMTAIMSKIQQNIFISLSQIMLLLHCEQIITVIIKLLLLGCYYKIIPRNEILVV